MTIQVELIPDRDWVSRFLFFPKSFKEGSSEIAEEGFITFEQNKGYSDSLVWRKYAPENQQVHAIGSCVEAKKKERNPDAEYKGFMSAQAKEIRSIEVEGTRLDVKHIPEEGIHHAEVYCIPGTKAKIKGSVRSDIKVRLYNLMAPRKVLYQNVATTIEAGD